jgi:hypothetical protein
MPTSFRKLVRNRVETAYADEESLERGRIFMFTETGVRTKSYPCVCWIAPCCGCVILEAWGAGGSGGRMSCCGGGIPGNAGAYTKKCFKVQAGCYITGCIGFSCGNTDSVCFRGCSEPTRVCWYGSDTVGCLCAQGGRGGSSVCSTGTSLYCCFANCGFCATAISGVDNCGIICNYGPGAGAYTLASCCAQAYGGDYNCFGGFSCAGFFGCRPNCVCSQVYFVTTPAGYFSTDGTVLEFGTEEDNQFSNWSGQGHMQYIHAINTASRMPAQGIPTESKCWTGGRSCGCYEAQGCVVWYPPGFPGMAPSPCVNVCDVATRGGHGAVRIKFIASES